MLCPRRRAASSVRPPRCLIRSQHRCQLLLEEPDRRRRHPGLPSAVLPRAEPFGTMTHGKAARMEFSEATTANEDEGRPSHGVDGPLPAALDRPRPDLGDDLGQVLEIGRSRPLMRHVEHQHDRGRLKRPSPLPPAIRHPVVSCRGPAHARREAPSRLSWEGCRACRRIAQLSTAFTATASFLSFVLFVVWNLDVPAEGSNTMTRRRRKRRSRRVPSLDEQCNPK